MNSFQIAMKAKPSAPVKSYKPSKKPITEKMLNVGDHLVNLTLSLLTKDHESEENGSWKRVNQNDPLFIIKCRLSFTTLASPSMLNIKIFSKHFFH